MNSLIIWKDIVLFWGKNPRAISAHQHPAIQFVLGETETFLSKDSTGVWHPQQGLLIAANHRHECDARDLQILTLGIDPMSHLGEWIHQQFLQSQKLVHYPTAELNQLDFAHFKLALRQEDWPDIRTQLEEIFHFTANQAAAPPQKNERIQAVVDYIAEHIESKMDTQSLMEVAHLSESRLLHLFKAQMGLPIRNYILWYRLQQALKYVLQGETLTQAAFLSGFADQAHMTRTCVNMVGIPPSFIVKNSKFIQLSFPT